MATIYLTTEHERLLEAGQAGVDYRCVMLPASMTRACLEELARLINEHQLEDCNDTDAECAVRAFLIVQRHRT